ncbi:hypothetical protein [Klebsiella pneumoniae]|uniref:hypothetical protein n=1 Tax=Klebsiella pneumoniae TaxID=573 RepID=UPI001867ACA0|nr:hypothetical protein [Klebsiella pneumoniae]MBE3231531.1 hypothetical protein [Klebsiella pneumoniae]MCF1868344.1 hypothetical protein [Klebsiella pneumoniae]
MEKEKISFLFPSFPSESDIETGSLGTPNMAVTVEEFPAQLSFLAATGLVNLDLNKGYALTVNLYDGDTLLTNPEDTAALVAHKHTISQENYYVSSFGIPLNARINKPGIYTLRFSLYVTEQGEKSDLLDELESQLAISRKWY